MRFTVGLKLKSKADHIVVDAEDALIAALKVKTPPARGAHHVRASIQSPRRRAPSCDPPSGRHRPAVTKLVIPATQGAERKSSMPSARAACGCIRR